MERDGDLSSTMIPSATIPIMNPVEPLIDTVAIELNSPLSAGRPGLGALDVDIQTTSPSGRDYTICQCGFLPVPNIEMRCGFFG